MKPGYEGPVDPRTRVGERVGRYIVHSVLGRGAMGVVLSAYDPALDRKVALKLLAPTRATKRELRLRREAQALARLDHPNVVTVYEVDQHAGCLFIAMEHVEGVTMRNWLDTRDGTLRWSVTLPTLLAAGRGLAAAHAVGLVHRDFKPENVMVSTDDRVRVMDFGLVRRDANLSEESSMSSSSSSGVYEEAEFDLMPPELYDSFDVKLTRTLALIGTPAYMAAEQFRRKDADARSDQFSFCVVAYEALYGRRPFRGNTIQEIRDAVCSGSIQAPPRGAQVPGWILPILERGLCEDPDARFPSMNALLSALSTDPTLRYKRLGIGAALALSLSLSAWLGGTVAQPTAAENPCTETASLTGVWDELRKEELAAAMLSSGQSYARDSWKRVERGLDMYTSDWAEARVEACEATRDGVQSSELLDRRMICLDRRLDALRALTGEIIESPSPAAIEHSTRAVASLPRLEPCADTEALLAADSTPDDPKVEQELEQLEAMLARAEAKHKLADHAQALTLTREIVERAHATGWIPFELRARLRLARIQLSLDAYDEAEEGLDHVHELSLDHKLTALAAETATRLARLVLDHGKPEDAKRWAAKSDSLAHLTGTVEARVESLLAHAELDHVEGQLSEARSKYETALALAKDAGEFDTARELNITIPLATILLRLEAFDVARVHLTHGLTLAEREYGATHPRIARVEGQLAILEHVSGDSAAARRHYERAIQIGEAALGPTHSLVLDNVGNLGVLVREGGDLDLAYDLFERSRAALEALHGPEHTSVGRQHLNIAYVEKMRGDPETAHEHATRARELFERSYGSDHYSLILILFLVGELELELERPAEAIGPLSRALELAPGVHGFEFEHAMANFRLAQALTALGKDPQRAKTLAETARELFLTHPPDDQATLDEVEAWLGEHN